MTIHRLRLSNDCAGTRERRRAFARICRRVVTALTPSVLVCFVAFPALAGDRSPNAEGAKALHALFDPYLPRTADGGSSYEINVERANYVLTVDYARLIAPLVALFDPPDFSMAPYKVTYLLTEQDDGLWRVNVNDQPILQIAGRINGVNLTMRQLYAGYQFAGVFDSKLPGFKDATMSFEKDATVVTSPLFEQQTTRGLSTLKIVGAPEGDAVTTTMILESANNRQVRVKTPSPESSTSVVTPTTQSTITSDNTSIFAVSDSLHVAELQNLWQFLAAYPNKAALQKVEPDFKVALRAALPLFDHLTQKIAFTSFKASFPGSAAEAKPNHFAAGVIGAGFTLSGVMPEAGLSGGLKANDIEIRTDIVPQWAQPFLPKDIELALSVSGYNLSAATETLIDGMHLNETPIISKEVAALAADRLKTSGPIKFVLERTTIRSSALTLIAEGEVVLSGPGAPSARFDLKSPSLDDAIQAAETAAASDPIATQAPPFLIQLKSMARNGFANMMVWDVAFENGQTTINGEPFAFKPQNAAQKQIVQ